MMLAVPAPALPAYHATTGSVSARAENDMVGIYDTDIRINQHPVEALPPVRTEDDLRWLAQNQPEDLVKYAKMQGLVVSLRACAVDAFCFLMDADQAVAESILAFRTRDIILQEAALGVLLELRTNEAAVRFIEQVARSAEGEHDDLVVEIAREMVADHF